LRGTSAAADHAAHAGARSASAGVDAADAGMMMRAAQHFQVQQAGYLVIVEDLLSRDVAEHVLALRALSDLLEVVVALVGEQVFAEFEHSRPQARRAPGDARRPRRVDDRS
jgi:hypothetical protein